MSPAPGVGPLNADQSAYLRRSLENRRGSDLSPGERYSADVKKDSVVVTDLGTGEKRTVPVKGLSPKQVSVSDRGDLAIVADVPGGQNASVSGPQVVGRLQPDGTFQEADRSYGLSSPELSADGSRLTWLALCDVLEEGSDGPRQLVKCPIGPERSAFLEDGRLLVRSQRDPWGTGSVVPYYFLVDPAGSVTPVDDLPTAEALGIPVRERLEGVHKGLFAGATPEQCRELVDLFGYRVPAYRNVSPSGDHSVFHIDAGADGQPFGLYRIEPGKGLPAPALSPADAATMGEEKVIGVVWGPDERRAAVTFGGPQLRGGVVDFQGTSRLLPGELASCVAGWWSPDGRWLAVEVKEGDHVAVHLYDADNDEYSPLVPQGQIKGWSDQHLEVAVGGVVRRFLPGPLDVERGREYVLGPKAEEPGTIQEGEGEVQVGGISLPVRKDKP